MVLLPCIGEGLQFVPVSTIFLLPTQSLSAAPVLFHGVVTRAQSTVTPEESVWVCRAQVNPVMKS